jgi:hypothetical protein
MLIHGLGDQEPLSDNLQDPPHVGRDIRLGVFTISRPSSGRADLHPTHGILVETAEDALTDRINLPG